MKKIILAIAFALVTLSMSGKEVSKNESTGLVLDETSGVYSIKGKLGVIILGDLNKARNFMFDATVCFTQEKLSGTIDCGEQKFKVEKDDTGMYIIKVGLGGVKIRPGDATQFLTFLESRIIKNKAGKIWDVIKE